MILGETSVAHVQAYESHHINVPDIDAAASGRGYLNDTRDPDGVVRTMPLLLAVQGELAPTLALELLRVALGIQWYSVHGSSSGVHDIQLGESLIPTDPDGRIRLYFSPAYAIRRVSALSILRGTQEPGFLANRIALIGATGVGVTDVAATPVATRMDGVEIQAQVLENLLDGARLLRPALTRWLELCVFLGIALVFILLFPRLRPAYGILVFLAGVVITGAGSLACFLFARWLVDPTFPTVGNIPMLVVLLAAGLATAERQRRELDAALEEARLERMRIAGELQAAREIQMGMLPAPGAIAGLPANLAFHAILEPAQEVGGDLYDAFMLDAQHFFFLVGDVSGKGVSASLFMALSKTLCKSVVLRAHGTLDILMCTVNKEISRANPADLFVTALMGVIDTHTGEVEFCVAGHDAPILLRIGEPPRALETIGGPPLCVLDDFPYTANRLRLQPDDMLLLITDGITEAQDPEQQLYTLPRALAYLTSIHHEQLTAARACQGLYDDVKRFTSGAPPSDDITVMAIRFSAPTGQ
jgi:serine phosphatase RsbU (regulator of sigma subunit)